MGSDERKGEVLFLDNKTFSEFRTISVFGTSTLDKVDKSVDINKGK